MQLAAAALRQLAEVQATLAVVQGASVAPTRLRSHLTDGRQGLPGAGALKAQYLAVLEPMRQQFLEPLASISRTSKGEVGYSPLRALYAYAAPPVTEGSHSFDIYMPLMVVGYERLLQCGPTAPEHLPADYVHGITIETGCAMGVEATNSAESFRAATRKLATRLLAEAQERPPFQNPISNEYVTATRHHARHHAP
jgi:hypothetical protein